ncbi:MAG: 30S ribosomal protein S12 methylthiotransferase RimO [Candidatus Borkfalkiaceae bacterium]|nr:30S ribosomal protein S12 methylthiotransferase RimO [Christensenellaceae bacterium]
MTFNNLLKEKTIGVISLGCDKNRVDTEKMLAILGSDKITQDQEDAQIIIVNSCAFLESSRKEAIETVFEVNELRKTGKLEKIVLTGCMPQKFVSEMFDEFKEVDVFLGTGDYEFLPEAIELAYQGERVNFVGKAKEFKEKKRVVTTPLHYAYLKIADGCDNHCTYCLIPSIRGKYRSEKEEDLLAEAQSLGDVKELILVAQDVTRYGEDINGENKFVELLQKLSALDNIGSIRILYCYPDKLTDELIAEIRNNDKIIKYLDIPLQHADPAVLKRMNRKGTGEGYLALIAKLRKEIPDIAIRSTFIAGFPGETEEQFENLLDFIKEAKFTNAGFFAYSREEGTAAYRLPDQIDEKVKQSRVKKLYAAQKKVSGERNKSLVGKRIKVICDGVDYDKQSFFGRAYFSAPEIDGKVYFTYDGEIQQGEYYDVKITKADAYDLYGVVTEV